jgi:hypothetical protein
VDPGGDVGDGEDGDGGVGDEGGEGGGAGVVTFSFTACTTTSAGGKPSWR